jgi:two-component system phosphate regulon sensor histidine kinase PhoR
LNSINIKEAELGKDAHLHPCVWIVDDSALDAERARRALADDYRVVVFRDGAAAIEQLVRSAGPDIIVLDWVMPGISGLDVCRFLRSRPTKGNRVAILLLTAQQRAEQVVEGLGAGANDYLAKPYADEELRARVGALAHTNELLARAEQAEAWVRNMLDQAPDPLLAIDADRRVRFLNQAAAAVFRRAPEELFGSRLDDLIADFPAIVGTQAGTTAATLGMGPPLGPLRDLAIGDQLFAPVIRPITGDPQMVATIALRNVTEQRRAEERRLDFYAIVAHDLRSPLSSTLMRTARILRGKFGLLPAELLADVRKMEATLRSQVVLINDFLELARLETVGYKLDREPIDLRTVVEETVEEAVPLIEAGKLHLNRQLGDRPVEIRGDERRLVQVVSNLLGNAIKFTPPGGELTVRMEREGSQIRTAIADTGPGIAPEALPTLFDRFTRASESAVVGTGLGLMIVREIVTAHGGTVGVESQLGQGSTFWFRIPADGATY